MGPNRLLLKNYLSKLTPKLTLHTVTADSQIVQKKEYPSTGSWTWDLSVMSSTLWHWAKKFNLRRKEFACVIINLGKILFKSY